jgi:transcriptional regulator with XRE-family HTH domain
MEQNELIDRISFIRTRANLSARKLSMLIGKAEGYIHRLEQSRDFAPTFDSLMAILEVCKTSFEEFAYYSIPQYQIDKQLLGLLKTATAEKKATALAVLNLKA